MRAKKISVVQSFLFVVLLFMCTEMSETSENTTHKSPQVAEVPKPIRALQRYPQLKEYFPYGFWHGQAPHAEMLSGFYHETYEQRGEKIYSHLARHHINAILPANRKIQQALPEVAQKYGLRVATEAGYLHGHVSDGIPMETVMETCRAHVMEVKDQPVLLAYQVYDEPKPDLASKIQQVTDMIRQADPNHPPIFTQNHLHLDREVWKDEWQLLESLDIHLSDCYPIRDSGGRDPWLYGDVMISGLYQANPEALSWPIVQAFTKPHWSLPTVAELRVMVYHTLASGAKGIFFFTTNQSYIGPWSSRQWFYRGSGNAWFGKEDFLEEIGRIGEHLTTAGHLLIPLRYAPDYPVSVDPPQMFQHS